MGGDDDEIVRKCYRFTGIKLFGWFFFLFSRNIFLNQRGRKSDVEVKAKQWLMGYWLKWIYGANSALMVRSELKCFRLASMVEGKSDWDVSGSCSDSATSLSLQTIIFQKIFLRFLKVWKDVTGRIKFMLMLIPVVFNINILFSLFEASVWWL